MATSQDQEQPVRESEPAVLISAHSQMATDAASLADGFDLFADLLDRNGLPPLWRREASFATLVRFILEQQVSLASAQAAFERLATRLGSVTPQHFVRSSDEELRADGFSRQKMGYVRGLAEMLLDGHLDIDDLPKDPEVVRKRLLEVRGIGPWTASCYLLFVCGERDIWPTGDRALYVSMASNLGLDSVPSAESADAIAHSWSPRRSTAARMLWHDYLGGRSHVPMRGAGFVGGTGKVRP